MASLVEEGFIGAVDLVGTIVPFVGMVMALVFVGIIYGFYLWTAAKDSDSESVTAKTNAMRAVMLQIAAISLLVLALGYLFAYYKVGTWVVTNHDGKVSKHNWTYFAGLAVMQIGLAVVFSLFYRFPSNASRLLLVLLISVGTMCYGAGQFQEFGYKRALVGASGFLMHAVALVLLWWCSEMPKSPFYSPRTWATTFLLFLSALALLILFFIGQPNEPSNRATVDSRGLTQLMYFLFVDIPQMLCFLIAILAYLPSGAPENMRVRRRRRRTGSFRVAASADSSGASLVVVAAGPKSEKRSAAAPTAESQPLNDYYDDESSGTDDGTGSSDEEAGAN